MSDNEVLRAWEEKWISREMGSRIVHYFLKDSIGGSLLAVVGKDRCVNHLVYAVSEDYLRVYGPTSEARADTKWLTRRDVIHWLVSVVSRGGPLLSNSTNLSVKCRVSKKTNDGQKKPAGELEVSGQPNRKTLKIERSGKGPNVVNLVAHEPRCRVLPKLGESIELFNQGSGSHGCWFRCKVLHSSQDRLMVRYKDVLEIDGSQKLEDWVPTTRVAPLDKLGMRCEGRLTVRPPARENPLDGQFVVGSAVDVWWCSCWWEGVVVGCNTPEKSKFQIYFPGDDMFLTVARRNIRISRDWIGGKWVDIKAKSDILSFLSSIFSTGKTLSPVAIKYASTTLANGEVLNPRKLVRSKDDKRRIPSSTSSDEPKAVEEHNFKKRLLRRFNEEASRGKSD